MNEEKKTNEETTTESTTTADTVAGVQQKTISELDRADQIAERQIRANKERLDILDREEALEARRKVGGVTGAGQPSEKPKEETPVEYKNRVMSNELE